MKQGFKLIFTSAILLAGFGLHAQTLARTAKTPRWISEKGFWQIESNIRTPRKNTVYFYTREKVLIYKENLDGVLLDLQKRRVKMQLKKALEAAIFTWNKEGRYQQNQQWVSVFFKR